MGLYAFRYLDKIKIDACVVNTFHLPEQVENLYLTQPYYKGKISISNESPQILGSAGGIKQAEKYFSENETILMLNADEIFFTQDQQFLQKAYQKHLDSENLATLVVTAHPEAGKKFGAIWVNEKNTVLNIGKENNNNQLIPYHYIGYIFLNKKILALIPEGKETNIFYDILIHELKNNSVGIYQIDCHWYETGNGLDFLNATKKSFEYVDEDFLQFINQYDSSRIIINQGGASLVSNSISLDEKKLSGFNCISKTTQPEIIDQLAKIQSSILFEGEVINSDYFA